MIYEYRCLVCNHGFEVEQSIKDDPLEDCPQCLTCALKRVVTGGQGFVLKGGGWYSDGYASRSDKDE